uniref:Uncharacterized protein n=1 Tax=Anguilla anguilla TaxID=7936 RepID=A0A0E9Q900_ANGAN
MYLSKSKHFCCYAELETHILSVRGRTNLQVPEMLEMFFF